MIWRLAHENSLYVRGNEVAAETGGLSAVASSSARGMPRQHPRTGLASRARMQARSVRFSTAALAQRLIGLDEDDAIA